MRPTVLLVDDSPDACATTAKMIWTWGFQVDIAHFGRMALRLVQENEYPVSIIDYQLPDMTGVELFRRMHKLRPGICGVFLTAFSPIEIVIPAVDAGIAKVLRKPIDPEELMPIIEGFAGEPA